MYLRIAIAKKKRVDVNNSQYRPRWKKDLIQYVKAFRKLPLATQKRLLHDAIKTDTRNITFEEKKQTATLTTDKSTRIKWRK